MEVLLEDITKLHLSAKYLAEMAALNELSHPGGRDLLLQVLASIETGARVAAATLRDEAKRLS